MTENRACAICHQLVEDHDRPAIQRACDARARQRHAGPGHEQPIEGTVGDAITDGYAASLPGHAGWHRRK